jgi:formylglycine-generating enzyme required for sulfatase activity
MIDPDDAHAAPHGLGAVVARDQDEAPIDLPGPSAEALALVRRASPLRLGARLGLSAIAIAIVAISAVRARAWAADRRARRAPMTHVMAGATAAFDLDRHEITVGDYRTCVARHRCSLPVSGEGCNGRMDHVDDDAITCVAHDQRAMYCAWVKKRTPTERELDRAARDGLVVRGSAGFRCAR